LVLSSWSGESAIARFERAEWRQTAASLGNMRAFHAAYSPLMRSNTSRRAALRSFYRLEVFPEIGATGVGIRDE
jgi:hypothetical protein